MIILMGLKPGVLRFAVCGVFVVVVVGRPYRPDVVIGRGGLTNSFPKAPPRPARRWASLGEEIRFPSEANKVSEVIAPRAGLMAHRDRR